MTNKEQRRKRRIIRSTIRFGVCMVSLALVLVILSLLTTVIKATLVTEAATNNVQVAAEEQNPENLLGDKQEEPTGDKKPEEKKPLLKVCIDPGHGGKDKGANLSTRYEKDDNLKMSLALQKYLESKNVEVVMTRDDDSFLKLSQRCKIANNADVDYMISIHRNSGDGNGVESWLYSNASSESASLADHIMENLEAVGISRNRGISYGTMESKNQDYYINSASNATSLILELGFLNNKEDNRLLDENLDGYAEAIGKAIIATYEEFHE